MDGPIIFDANEPIGGRLNLDLFGVFEACKVRVGTEDIRHIPSEYLKHRGFM
jgi:hypothetical protein